MVAAAVVCYRPCRRLDRISRFATESYRSADDLLATAAAARIQGDDIFRHLLLPWQRRSVPELGVASERRSRYPSVYDPRPAGHARSMVNRSSPNDCGGGGEYVTNGSGGHSCVARRYRRAFWPRYVAKTTRWAEERRRRRSACHYFRAHRARSSGPSGATA